MKRFLISAATVLAVAWGALASSVSADDARALARAWVQENAAFSTDGDVTAVFAECDTNKAQTVLWYQVSLAKGGCLMVAPVTEIEPVLAALEKDPGKLPAAHPLRAILANDIRKRLRFLGLYTEDAAVASLTRLGVSSSASAAPSAAATAWGAKQAAKWARLAGIGAEAPSLLKAAASVGVKDPIATEIAVVKGFEQGGPLTHWNQSSVGGGYCYNYYTTNHVVCGCVATAIAAILQFFEAERVAPVEKTCAYDGASFKAQTMQTDDPMNLTSYDWSLFADLKTREDYDTLTQEQRELLGRVAYDAGVCVSMDWGTPEGSAALGGQTAGVLRDYFGYIEGEEFKRFAEARCVGSPKADQYEKLIYAQLRAGVPVQMDIEGHAVVAVGFGRDGDGVSRTRVFMGWGGAGDAWYALPDIDTTAVLGGGSYLSSIITSIATFIGYKDDSVVPVTGQVIPALDAAVTCNGTEIKANKNGFFGTRLSAAQANEVTLACMGKSVTVATGKLPAKEDKTYENGAALAAAVPDPVTILLLNSQSAVNETEAREMALAADKPMLFFSGSSGTPASDALWQIISDLDKYNIRDFTNQYVIAYFSWDGTASSSSDGQPSCAIFDPADYDPANRWASFNGRLSYLEGASYVTNVTADATNYVATAETTNALSAVLAEGLFAYKARRSGITVTVSSVPEDLFPAETNAAAFVAGVASAFEAPACVTNETAGVIYACAGWKVTDAAGGEVASGTTPQAVFTPAADDTDYALTWFWDATAVRVTCTPAAAQDGTVHGQVALGSVTNNAALSAWVDLGASVTFAAVPEDAANGTYRVAGWETEGPGTLEVAEDARTCACTVRADAAAAVSVTLSFVKQAYYLLTVTSAPAAVANRVSASPSPAFGKAYHANGLMTATSTPAEVTLSGTTWACARWSLAQGETLLDSGDTSRAEDQVKAAFDLESNATLSWRWAIDLAASLERQGWDPAVPTAQAFQLALPEGLAAEEVTLVNVPATWSAAQELSADGGTLAVAVAPTENWTAEYLGVTLANVTQPEAVTNGVASFVSRYVVATNQGNIEVTAPAAFTNETTGLIWVPETWQAVTNGTVVAEGSGATASFACAAGEACTLTWTWQAAGARLSAAFSYPEKSSATQAAFYRLSAMDFYEQWRLFGETATFTITNVYHGVNLPEALAYWQTVSTNWLPNGLSATVTATAAEGPVTLYAVMTDGFKADRGAVTIAAAPATCTWGTSTPAYGETLAAQTDVWSAPEVVTLASGTYTEELPNETNRWHCTGWTYGAADGSAVFASGTGTAAQFTRTADDGVFTWLWEKVAQGGDPEPGPTPQYAVPTPIAFTGVAFTDTDCTLTFTNAVRYCIYKLYAGASPAAIDLSAEPVRTMTWQEDDGPATFTVPVSDATLFWKVVGEPGLIGE